MQTQVKSTGCGFAREKLGQRHRVVGQLPRGVSEAEGEEFVSQAEQGYTARQIVQYYYPGTTFASLTSVSLLQ